MWYLGAIRSGFKTRDEREFLDLKLGMRESFMQQKLLGTATFLMHTLFHVLHLILSMRKHLSSSLKPRD